MQRSSSGSGRPASTEVADAASREEHSHEVRVPRQVHRVNLTLRAVLQRTLWLLVVWVVLMGAHAADVAVGVVAAALGAAVSVRLLPPQRARLRPRALTRLAVGFLGKSVVAGADVARRALSPSLPLRPGFVRYPLRFAPGPARNAFASETSLLPGTLPVSDDGDTILYHCLDVSQPIAEQLGAEEQAIARVFEGERGDG